MPRSTDVRSFPTSDDPVARFEAVVRRGRALHRREQLVRGSGAGGAVAASALAVGLLVGGRGERVTTDETASVVTLPPATVPPGGGGTGAPEPDLGGGDGDTGGQLTVDADLDGRTLTLTVVDPHQPAVVGAQACVTVNLTAPSGPGPVAEGRGCDADATDGDLVAFDLVRTQDASVVCAAVVERPLVAERGPAASPDDPVASDGGPVELAPVPSLVVPRPEPLPADPSAPTSSTPGHTTTTRSVRHQFTAEVPDLAPGRYQLRVMATSGVGDGCDAEAEGANEFERSTELLVEVEVR